MINNKNKIGCAKLYFSGYFFLNVLDKDTLNLDACVATDI